MLRIISIAISRYNLSSIKRKMFKNIYWAVIGRVVNIFSGLLVGVFIARYLGPDQYGLMNYVISYVTIFSIFSSFGFSGIEVRELAKERVDRNVILGTAIVLRIAFGFVTMLLVVITLIIFETDSLTFWLILIYSITLVFNSLEVIRNYFTAIILNEYIVKIDILRTIIIALLKLLLLGLSAKLQWFIIVSVFDIALLNTGYWIVYRNEKLTIRTWLFDKTFAKFLIKESYPLLFSGMAILIYQKVDQILIRNMINNAAVGQFAVAAKLAEFLVVIPSIIIQTISPALVMLHNNDKRHYEIKKQEFLDIIIWISFFLGFVTFLLSKLLVINLFGNDYKEAVSVLRVLAWKSVVVSLSLGSAQLIVIEGLQKFAVLRNIFGSIINLVFNLLLIPTAGILGSAYASIIAIAFAGYFSHLIIEPYRFLFKLQSKALFLGYKSIIRLIQSKT